MPLPAAVKWLLLWRRNLLLLVQPLLLRRVWHLMAVLLHFLPEMVLRLLPVLPLRLLVALVALVPVLVLVHLLVVLLLLLLCRAVLPLQKVVRVLLRVVASTNMPKH